MLVELSPGQIALRQTACKLGRRFASEWEIGADCAEANRVSLFQRLGDAGLLAPAGALDMVVALEGITEATGDAGLSASWATHTALCGSLIDILGTDDQRDRFFPGLSSGAELFAHAVSEETTGEEIATGMMRAEWSGQCWHLTGTKTGVLNAPHARHFLTVAATDAQHSPAGHRLFLVDRTTEGLCVGLPIKSVGTTSAPAAHLQFERCQVPPENVLNVPVAPQTVLQLVARLERVFLVAPWVGLLKSIYEICLNHAATQVRFGKPLGQSQLVRAALADMKLAHSMAQHLLHRAALSVETGAPSADLDAAISKRMISDRAEAVVSRAIEILGHHTLDPNHPVSRAYHDVKALTAVGGSNRVLQSAIAGALLDKKIGGV